MTNLRQSGNFARFMKLSGWTVEKAGKCYVYIRKIPHLPPLIMKIQYPTPPIPFVLIEKLIQKYRPFKIQIQPLKIENNFKQYGYRQSRETAHVTKTIQLDLTQPEAIIFSRMKKDARYGIKKAKKKGIQILKLFENPAVKTPRRWALCPPENRSLSRVRILLKRRKVRLGGNALLRGGGNEIKLFRQAWRKSVGWQRHVPSLKTLLRLQKAFGRSAVFLMAKSGKDTPEMAEWIPRRWRKKDNIHGLIAGAVILIANPPFGEASQTAYYYYAFTSKQGRRSFAQYLLVWEAIKLAKKQGCKTFDFEGIYDSRFPVKSWQGFSHFKKSFGGKEIEYPGCWVSSLNICL